MRSVLIAGLVWLLFGSTGAESAVQRFTCVFDRHVSPDTSGVSRADPLRYEFVVDEQGGAFAVANNVYPVRFVIGYEGVTFLEELKSGVVQSTTIHTNGEAVHSRHTILLGQFVPSQYYGTCLYEQD